MTMSNRAQPKRSGSKDSQRSQRSRAGSVKRPVVLEARKDSYSPTSQRNKKVDVDKFLDERWEVASPEIPQRARAKSAQRESCELAGWRAMAALSRR